MTEKVFVERRSARIGRIGVAASAAALATACAKGPPVTSPNAALRSTQTGVYTEAQATAGKATFDVRCAGCHTTGARLASPDFRKGWHGQTVWKLFSLIRETMPSDNPGSLTDQQYAEVFAYVVQSARMGPGGTTALPTDSATLSKIRMDTVVVR
jgi:mono/diheme cytochrome c family protein